MGYENGTIGWAGAHHNQRTSERRSAECAHSLALTGMFKSLTVVLLLCHGMAWGQPTYFDGIYGNPDPSSPEGIVRGGSVAFGDGHLHWSRSEEQPFLFITDEYGNQVYSTYPQGSASISRLHAKNVISISDSVFIGLFIWDSPDLLWDYGIMQFRPDGEVLWERNYGFPERSEIPQWVFRTNDGGYAIVGQTIIDNGSSEQTDVYLVKTDSIGNELWNQSYGGYHYEGASSMLQTPDNGFLIFGWTRSYGAGERDFYLIKTDSLGNQQWQRTYGNSQLDSGHSIVSLSDGNYLLAGYRNLNSKRQGYLYKIDDAGTVIWENEYGEDITTEEFHNVLELPNGDFIATGLYDPYGAAPQSDNGGLLVRISGEGNEIWKRVYQKNQYTDLFYSVLATNDGGFLLSGQAVNEETMSQDAWLLKVDSVGCAYPNCITGVDEVEPTKVMVDVWPNPTSEVLHLELQQQGMAQIMLYDMAGKLLVQKQTTQQHEALDVSALENGLYLLTVLQGEMKTTVKVMVW